MNHRDAVVEKRNWRREIAVETHFGWSFAVELINKSTDPSMTTRIYIFISFAMGILCQLQLIACIFICNSLRIQFTHFSHTQIFNNFSFIYANIEIYAREKDRLASTFYQMFVRWTENSSFEIVSFVFLTIFSHFLNFLSGINTTPTDFISRTPVDGVKTRSRRYFSLSPCCRRCLVETMKTRWAQLGNEHNHI